MRPKENIFRFIFNSKATFLKVQSKQPLNKIGKTDRVACLISPNFLSIMYLLYLSNTTDTFKIEIVVWKYIRNYIDKTNKK